MTEKMNTYEGMFLVDANSDFHAASEPARTILSRNGAQVLSMKPWDERRLAYEIKGRRRGLYVLTYFKAPPGRIADIEHDSTLDERILRMLVLRRDNLSEEDIAAETPATASARRAAARRTEGAPAREKGAEKPAAVAAKEGEGDEPAGEKTDRAVRRAAAEGAPAEASDEPETPDQGGAEEQASPGTSGEAPST